MITHIENNLAYNVLLTPEMLILDLYDLVIFICLSGIKKYDKNSLFQVYITTLTYLLRALCTLLILLYAVINHP